MKVVTPSPTGEASTTEVLARLVEEWHASGVVLPIPVEDFGTERERWGGPGPFLSHGRIDGVTRSTSNRGRSAKSRDRRGRTARRVAGSPSTRRGIPTIRGPAKGAQVAGRGLGGTPSPLARGTRPTPRTRAVEDEESKAQASAAPGQEALSHRSGRDLEQNSRRWALLWSTGASIPRRGDWQPLRKQHEADSPEQAREWALSEIGGCHHVKRALIKIDSVTPAGRTSS